MTTATETATQVYRIYIKATPKAIWDAITKPEWTAKYGYRGIADYDLRPGGKYEARANDGDAGDGHAGTRRRRRGSGGRSAAEARPNVARSWDEEIKSEGPTRVTFDIEEDDGGFTRLTVTTSWRTHRSRPTRWPASPGSTRVAAAGAGSSAT